MVDRLLNDGGYTRWLQREKIVFNASNVKQSGFEVRTSLLLNLFAVFLSVAIQYYFKVLC